VLPVLDLGTGDPVSCVPVGCAADVDAAVASAAKAAAGWAGTRPPSGPGCSRLRRDGSASARTLAELTTGEMSKPLGDARGGVEAGIAAIEQARRRQCVLGPLAGLPRA
jgi:succinate-semialdehyde dehydrogenase/glutarate-semialdehyde dehydrogenase